MPKYSVRIQGQNFLIMVDDQIGKYGFFTSRFVEADDPAAAENSAVQMLRAETSLRAIVKNAAEDPPVMDVLEILKLIQTTEIDSQPADVWYEMHPKRWWQFWRR